MPRFAVMFALLFAVLVAAQYWLFYTKVQNADVRELKEWADQEAALLQFKDHWDLREFRRNADVLPPNTFVFAADGTIIETRGFLRDFAVTVKRPSDDIFQSPKVQTTETNEKWLLYGRKLQGGVVVLGILDFENIADPAKLLRDSADQFGKTLEDALKVRSGQTLNELDYAVIDDRNRLLASAEAIPLIAELGSIEGLTGLRGVIRRGENLYLVHSQSIKNAQGREAGTIILPKNLAGEQRALHDLLVTNAGMVGAVWLVIVGILAMYFKLEETRQRPKGATIEEALATGESQTIEFKEGNADKKLAEAICAFANTNSGTIFEGVKDGGEVVGLKGITPKEREDELTRVRDKATESIKPSATIFPEFLEYQGKLVLRIFVPRGSKVLYSLEGVQYVRKHNSSKKATPDDLERITKEFHS